MGYLRCATMRYIAILVLGGACSCFSHAADQQLTFRKATIGMPLAEFRAAANPRCTDSIQPPGENGSNGKLRDADSSIFAAREADEVVCHNYSESFDDFNIAGAEAQYVVYHFRNDRLYSIDISLPSKDYTAVKNWFTQSYGEPKQQPQTTFQNGYGSAWKAENLRWDIGEQAILISEGAGNGPGHAQGDTIIQIVDKGAKVDFASR